MRKLQQTPDSVAECNSQHHNACDTENKPRTRSHHRAGADRRAKQYHCNFQKKLGGKADALVEMLAGTQERPHDRAKEDGDHQRFEPGPSCIMFLDFFESDCSDSNGDAQAKSREDVLDFGVGHFQHFKSDCLHFSHCPAQNRFALLLEMLV